MTQPSVLSTRYSVLLAALLAFGSEILLWTNPPRRSSIEWALLAAGYVALSGLLLEIAARFRVRNVYGLLALAGVYGLLNGLILNPASALIDVPRTLITRAMGAHAVAGLVALAAFLLLTRAHRRRTQVTALGVALLLGVGWGTWARWSPVALNGQGETPLPTMLLGAAAGAVVIGLALVNLRRGAGGAADLRLGLRGWAFTLVMLGGLLILHLLRREIDLIALTVIITLTVFSVMMIWFQQRKKGAALFENLAPPSLRMFAALALTFVLAGVVGYQIPREDATSDPVAVIGALFTAYGLIWLPAISLVLGARAFSRQARAMKL